MNTISLVAETLFYLVRVAMGNDASKPIDKAVDWNVLLEHATRQGVAAITFDAIESLYNAGAFNFGKIVDGNLLQANWYGAVMMQEQVYRQHESTITKLSSFFANYGIDMMVLKGYGLSLNYPRPNHRPCGDIDIWLRGKQVEADEILKKAKGIIPHKSSHHTIFFVEGCEIENHITLLEYDTHKSNIPMDKYLTKLANEKAETIYVQGKRVLLPTPDFNAHFLLRHNAIHFTVEGITIRHLLDWATFVKQYSDDIDWNELYEYAGKNNMDVFLSCLNAICVDYLGYDAQLFPIRKKYTKLEKRIVNDVLSGEFNDVIPDRHRQFVKYCYVKTKRLWANRWKSRITNSDSFVSELFHYATNRVKETIIYKV